MISAIAKTLLMQYGSYIDALKAAIDLWEKAESFEAKKTCMRAIGDIGREIDAVNKATGLR